VARSRRERWRQGVADGEFGHGSPQPVIRREDAVVAVAMLAWRRDQVGEAVEEFVG